MAEWLARNRISLGLTLLNLLVLGGAVLYFRQPAPMPIGITPPPPTATPTATPTPGPLRVYVSGAVRNPDVYLLPPGSIVKEAIVAAGGPTEDADCDHINLARALHDGEHLYVPRQGETPPPTEPPAPAAQPSGLVDVNAATPAQLEALPGIGPALAQRIVEHRPYRTVDDLLEVPGIGPATLEKIRPLVTVGNP
ncbi:MAG: helix-hairpin-helix domain-containing protein [Anaerolineae bacterium]|nr:helix-hairpin-helix domain-containing protein [Anaerolineae bacterium]